MLIPATTWVDLEDILLSHVSQSEEQILFDLNCAKHVEQAGA